MKTDEIKLMLTETAIAELLDAITNKSALLITLALTAVFGSALGDADHATPQLTTDNLAFDSPAVTTSFPYLAPPN